MRKSHTARKRSTLAAILVTAVLMVAGQAKAPAASCSIPQPVPSHPRLWITTNDLPRLRSWATPTNPVYQALVPS